MTDRTCSIPGCPEPYHCKGYCRPHYMRNYFHGDTLGGGPFRRYVPDTPENFWARVDKAGPLITARPDLGPCWIWTDKLDIGGYGIFGKYGQLRDRVHRRSWRLANSEDIPDGMELDHLCHTYDLTCLGGKCAHRKCLSPLHLEPVSHRENALRGVRGRKQTCPEGHALEVLGLNRLGNPKRDCRTCRINRRAELRAQCVTGDPAAAALTATPETLATLAQIYRDAEAQGEPPRLAVSRHFGRSPATMSDWIRRARRSGYLPETVLKPNDRRCRAA